MGPIRGNTTTPLAFGTTPRGEAAKLFQLGSEQLRVQITNFGGRLVAIEFRGVAGTLEHMLLGFDNVAEYCVAGQSYGALLGRTANRIAGGRFCLDGRGYQLPKNDHGNTLHGGERGFENRLWEVQNATEDQLHLSLLSEDGDQGFPGNVTVSARYRLEGSTLGLEFDARTDRPTPLSTSAHPYFNLGGLATHDVLDHEITLLADSYLPTDAAQIPTGEIATATATPFDFRSPTPIARRIRASHMQLGYGRGFDHYFVTSERGQPSLRWAARARHPVFGAMPGRMDHPAWAAVLHRQPIGRSELWTRWTLPAVGRICLRAPGVPQRAQ